MNERVAALRSLLPCQITRRTLSHLSFEEPFSALRHLRDNDDTDRSVWTRTHTCGPDQNSMTTTAIVALLLLGATTDRIACVDDAQGRHCCRDESACMRLPKCEDGRIPCRRPMVDCACASPPPPPAREPSPRATETDHRTWLAINRMQHDMDDISEAIRASGHPTWCVVAWITVAFACCTSTCTFVCVYRHLRTRRLLRASAPKPIRVDMAATPITTIHDDFR